MGFPPLLCLPSKLWELNEGRALQDWLASICKARDDTAFSPRTGSSTEVAVLQDWLASLYNAMDCMGLPSPALPPLQALRAQRMLRHCRIG